ncbi:MAG TPA: hypothetical protein VK665_02115 [Candidatus Elarobacter sp.]|nr:hypothetical protein [Candidatus Elarobacter sp.]
MQCADWICGLLGRYAAYVVKPEEFREFAWSQTRFEESLLRVSRRSQILTVAQRESTVHKATLRRLYRDRLRQRRTRSAAADFTAQNANL